MEAVLILPTLKSEPNNNMTDHHEKELSVELQDGTRIWVVVNLKGQWENDGIGAYEYAGHKEHHAGSDYYSVLEWEWDKHGLSLDEVDEIDAEIESAIPAWEAEIVHEAEGDLD